MTGEMLIGKTKAELDEVRERQREELKRKRDIWERVLMLAISALFGIGSAAAMRYFTKEDQARQLVVSRRLDVIRDYGSACHTFVDAWASDRASGALGGPIARFLLVFARPDTPVNGPEEFARAKAELRNQIEMARILFDIEIPPMASLESQGADSVDPEQVSRRLKDLPKELAGFGPALVAAALEAEKRDRAHEECSRNAMLLNSHLNDAPHNPAP